MRDVFKWLKIFELNNTETDSIAPGQVIFLFYFHPKSLSELDFLLKRDHFNHLVFFDKTNEINKLNQFPDNMMYQVLLLDASNRVILIGNPALNPQIWDLYKQQITGAKHVEPTPLTAVSIEPMHLKLKGLVINKTTHADFILHNTGTQVLIKKK